MFDIDKFEKHPFEPHYNSTFRLDNREVRIDLRASATDSKATIQARLNEKMAWVLGQSIFTLKYISAELLPIKNENWLKPGEAAKSESDFLRGLQLQSVLIREDGSMELRHHAGPLFWGHWVTTALKPDFQFEFTTLEG